MLEIQNNYVDRRRFVNLLGKTLVLSTAISSCQSSENVYFGEPTQEISPPLNSKINNTEKRTLELSDFEFVGWFRLPSINNIPQYNNDFMFSRGPLASREINGERRFFMPAHVENQHCVEFTDPGNYSKTISSSTPKSKLIRAWGDIYKDKLSIPGDPGQKNVTPYVDGYFWDGEKLWWQVARRYNAGSNFHDTCLGCSFLRDDGTSSAYGKWRIGPLGSFRYCNFITEIPADFADAYTPGLAYGIGANQHSGYQSTPYGPNLNAFALPNLNTPPDVYTGTHSGPASVSAITLVGYDIKNRLDVPTRRYRRDQGPYSCKSYPLSDAGSLPAVSYWAEQVDETATCSWINLPDKHGVVWLGQLCDVIPGYKAPNDPDGLPHYGYGDPDGPRYGEGRPVNHCCHGQDDPSWEATGPFCHSTVPWVFIMDPLKFVPVINGTKKPWDLTPNSAFRLNNIIELSSHSSGRVGRLKFGGAYFDSARRLLFVTVKGMDDTSTYYARIAIMVIRIK